MISSKGSDSAAVAAEPSRHTTIRDPTTAEATSDRSDGAPARDSQPVPSPVAVPFEPQAMAPASNMGTSVRRRTAAGTRPERVVILVTAMTARMSQDVGVRAGRVGFERRQP
jgi:hypothetical protein